MEQSIGPAGQSSNNQIAEAIHDHIHKRSSAEEKARIRHEKEKENEICDAFGYFDRKKQGKIPISSLEDMVSMLGISLPPGDARAPLLKIADPSGNLHLSRIRLCDSCLA